MTDGPRLLGTGNVIYVPKRVGSAWVFLWAFQHEVLLNSITSRGFIPVGVKCFGESEKTATFRVCFVNDTVEPPASTDIANVTPVQPNQIAHTEH